MKVPEIKTAGKQSAKKARKADSIGGARFTDHLTPATESQAGEGVLEEAYAVSPVNSILSAQEVDEGVNNNHERHRIIQCGENVLDQLEQIRYDLLRGAIPAERLSALAQKLRDRKKNISDPDLLSLINDIELRAEIEIAKYSRVTKR